ncbi:MAG: hypothetical protein V4727_01240 [Verrucomicrobiota bacterium]
MKTQILSFAVLFGLIAGVVAEEAAKPLVSLTVKRQVLGTDKDERTLSQSRDKEMTLRVVIKNLSDTTLEGAELTGNVLINRAGVEDERIVKELLKPLKLPPMKPNENLTVDLGKFTLTKVEWTRRTFEETLEEWKVVCIKGETNIGENVSDEKYNVLVKEMKEKREEAVEKEEDKFEEKREILKRRQDLRKLRD